MKTSVVGIIICLGLAFSCAGARPALADDKNDHAAHPKTDDVIHWRGYEQGRKEARETRRPMLILFGHSLSHWCDVYKTESFADARVVKLLSQEFVPVELNENSTIDSAISQALIQALEVEIYPTVIITDAYGKVLTRFEGFTPADNLVRTIQRSLQDYRNSQRK